MMATPKLGPPRSSRNYTHPTTLVLLIDNRIDFTSNHKLNTPNIVNFFKDTMLSNIGSFLIPLFSLVSIYPIKIQ